MPYLMIKPDTYFLSKKEMYRYDTCQFCGSNEGHNYRRILDQRKKADTLWRRSCKSCGQTTAIIKKDLTFATF